MKSLTKVACVCAVSLIFLGSLCAEQTGEIRGKVTDEQGEALPGVAITAKSPSLQGIRNAVTDTEGNFRLPLLPIGIYSLTCQLDGFEKLILTEVDVRLGFTSTFSIVLKVAAISEEVTVLAENPLIDKTRGDNSYRLNADDLTRVHSQDRTITEIVTYTPGVTGVRTNTFTGGGVIEGMGTETGIASFRGEGGAGNNWLVDGLTIKSIGAVANSPEIRINYDAWEEVQIVSDGFAPELGQALGGYVNVVTKSGGNSFHGELGGLIRDRGLRAARQEQLSAASLPETSLSQYYGNLGGPLLRDKLWFFISDNFHQSNDFTDEQSVGWLDIPEGERRINANNFFGKITISPWRNHTLSFSGNLDMSINQSGGIGVPETYLKTDFTDYSYRINYRGILSQNTLLTAAWGQYKADESGDPLSGDYGPACYYWQDIGQYTNNIVQGWNIVQRRSDFALTLTQYFDFGRWGNHEFGAGFLYNKNIYELEVMMPGLDSDPWKNNGFDEGVDITWSSPGIPLILGEYAASPSQDSTEGIGFFIQDNIKVGRFSLMLGLRAETQSVYNDAGELVWKWGLGDFLVPRASLSVDLLGDSKNILKLSYGQFANPAGLQTLWKFNRKSALGYRIYNWVGGIDPTEDQLIDASNWEFIFEQSAETIPMEVDPALKPNTTTKFLLEFDRQLGANWAFKVRGVSSYSRNLTDDLVVYDPESQWVKEIYTNFDLKRRDYRALEVELNGRVGGKLWLDASYTWSQAKGTNSGNLGELAAWNSFWLSGYEASLFGNHPSVPQGEPNKELIDYLYYGLGGPEVGDEGWYGYLPYGVNHVIKILGTYRAPHGFVISSGIEYLSGYHWEKKGWAHIVPAYFTFPEGRGRRTTPPHMYLDLAVEKDIVLKKGMTLALGLNLYNLLNSQRPVSYLQEDTDLFGQVWARQLPRWLQIKATLRF